MSHPVIYNLNIPRLSAPGRGKTCCTVLFIVVSWC